MKRIATLLLAMIMALSLTACKKTPPVPTGQTSSDTSLKSNVELYSKTDPNTGSITIVDKDGNAVSEYTVDAGGNVVDSTGKIIASINQISVFENGGKSSTETTETEKKTDSSTDSNSDVKPSDNSEVPSVGKTTNTQKANDSSGSESSSSSSSSSNASITTEPSKPSQSSKPSEPTKPSQPSKPTHTHSYSNKTVAPSCSSDGYTIHTCSCGDSYKDNYKDALGHDWKAQYKTITIDDYETKCVWHCSVCNADITALLDSGSSMKQHRKETGCSSGEYYDAYEDIKVGSHTEKQLTGYTCTRCGATK